MACDRHETGPGSETCPDCLFALVVETRRALNESEAWAESQEREVDRLHAHVARLEESLRVQGEALAEKVEVLEAISGAPTEAAGDHAGSTVYYLSPDLVGRLARAIGGEG